MNKERVKILDNFIDCLSHDDLRYIIGIAIPYRFMFEAERKNNEKLNEALKIIRNPNSSERDVICAKYDYVKYFK